MDDFRGARRETQEGGRTVFNEPGRVIVVDPGGQSFIRHDEGERFRYGARDIRTEEVGGERRTIVIRPDGSQIITVNGRDGQLLRRIRRDERGREIIIIDNSYRDPGAVGGFYVDLPPPVIRIPYNRYIVDAEDASPDLIYDTMEAPPVDRIERRYSLDEIRYSPSVRQLMPSIDLNSINFETGSWEIPPNQAGRAASTGASPSAASRHCSTAERRRCRRRHLASHRRGEARQLPNEMAGRNPGHFYLDVVIPRVVPANRRDDPWLMSRLRRHTTPQQSIERELGRLAAQIRRRVQRLAVDRAVVVLAGERWVPDRRRECVIGEFAVAGQHFNAGIEPGAPADVDAGASLLVGHIGTVCAVIDAAALIVLTLGRRVGRCHGKANSDNGDGGQQHRKLIGSREFPGHQVLTGGRATISISVIFTAGGMRPQGQSGHTASQ